MNEDRWLSVDEIAEYLGVSKDTVYAYLSEGILNDCRDEARKQGHPEAVARRGKGEV